MAPSPSQFVPSKEQLEIAECRNKFRARKMPDFKHVSPLPEIPSQPITVPEPFTFRIDERLNSSSSRFTPAAQVTEDNAKRLRTKKSASMSDLNQPVMFHAGSPPVLRTEARATSRLKTRDRHRRKADEIKREKQFEALRRKREAQERTLQEAQTQRTTVVDVKPFHLESVARHEAYRRQLAERLEQEEREKRRQTEFRARPFKSPRPDSGKFKSPYTSPTPGKSPPRMGKPFMMEAMARHKAYQQQFAERLEQERLESRKKAEFHARPLKLVKPFEPTRKRASPTVLRPVSREASSHHQLEPERAKVGLVASMPFSPDVNIDCERQGNEGDAVTKKRQLPSLSTSKVQAPPKSLPERLLREQVPAVHSKGSVETRAYESTTPKRLLGNQRDKDGKLKKRSQGALQSTPQKQTTTPVSTKETGLTAHRGGGTSMGQKTGEEKRANKATMVGQSRGTRLAPKSRSPKVDKGISVRGQKTSVHAKGSVEKRVDKSTMPVPPDSMPVLGGLTKEDGEVKKRSLGPLQSTAQKQATTPTSPQDTGSTARSGGGGTSMGQKTGEEKSINQATLVGQSRSTALAPEGHPSQSQEVNRGTPSAVLIFVGLCIIRVLNTFLVYSYFDPDEFWQTMEPAYCAAFVDGPTCSGHTWEWKRRAPTAAMNLVESSLLGPARSYLSVLPTFLYFSLLKVLEADSTWLVSRGPMVLAAITVAAPVDLAVWYAAQWLGRPNEASSKWRLPAWSLFCSLTSWFSAYSIVRTFANGQEGLFLILAIVLVGPELLGNTQKGSYYLRAAAAFMLGGMSITIRVTSIAAFVPLGILLAFRQRSLVSKVGFLFFICAVFGLLGIFVGMLVDRFFFGFWTLPFLGNFHFNVILDNADLYGSHPFHWYFTAGLPAIAGLLLPFLWYDFVTVVDRPTYGQRNLWVIVVSYLVAMSLNGHKEFRYIYPVLPLVCLLTAEHVRAIVAGNGRSRLRTLVFGTLFVIPNVIAVLYLGLFHQTGPIAVNHAIVEAARDQLAQSQTTTYSVHYLTGACHSTPLHSHLHAPPIHFDTWSLDCSPDCRADPDAVCEYERFDRDPAGFVQEAYSPICLGEEEDEEVCQIQPDWPVPDFLVTFSSYADLLAPQLGDLGLHITDRFPQHLTGVKVGDTQICLSGCDESQQYHEVFDWLSFSMEEMVLYQRRPRHS